MMMQIVQLLKYDKDKDLYLGVVLDGTRFRQAELSGEFVYDRFVMQLGIPIPNVERI